jgi:hypothetical protein
MLQMRGQGQIEWQDQGSGLSIQVEFSEAVYPTP